MKKNKREHFKGSKRETKSHIQGNTYKGSAAFSAETLYDMI